MPVLEQTQLDELYQSITDFTEDAIQAAVDQAKDSEKALQFLERLKHELTTPRPLQQSFATVALCLVLGEARVEAAIPTLLEIATDPDREDTTQAVALYVLQRMEEPAWRAAMTIATDALLPAKRVLAYDIFDSAFAADESIRNEIADFCLSRIEVESLIPWPLDDWNPRDTAIYSMLILHDPRVEPIIQTLLDNAFSDDERKKFEYWLDFLDSDDIRESDYDWHVHWNEYLDEWAGALEIENEDLRNDEIRLERADKLAERKAYNAELTDAYRKYLRETATPVEENFDLDEFAADAAAEMKDFLDFAALFAGLDMRSPNLEDFRQAILEDSVEHYPETGESLARIARNIETFFRNLGAMGRLADAEAFANLAKEASGRLTALGSDIKKWGLAKLLQITGEDAGFDMNSRAGFNGFAKRLVKRMGGGLDDVDNPSELDELADGELDEFSTRRAGQYGANLNEDIIQPIRRQAPKVGRNDPCPCGSKKKYKKCCGK